MVLGLLIFIVWLKIMIFLVLILFDKSFVSFVL